MSQLGPTCEELTLSTCRPLCLRQATSLDTTDPHNALLKAAVAVALLGRIFVEGRQATSWWRSRRRKGATPECLRRHFGILQSAATLTEGVLMRRMRTGRDVAPEGSA